jgi:hypothetical protein
MNERISIIFDQNMKHRWDREKYAECCTSKERNNIRLNLMKAGMRKLRRIKRWKDKKFVFCFQLMKVLKYLLQVPTAV